MTLGEQLDNECVCCGKSDFKKDEKDQLCKELGICSECIVKTNKETRWLVLKRFFNTYPNANTIDIINALGKYGYDLHLVKEYLQYGYLIFKDVEKMSDLEEKHIDINKEMKRINIMNLAGQNVSAYSNENDNKSNSKLIKDLEGKYGKNFLQKNEPSNRPMENFILASKNVRDIKNSRKKSNLNDFEK